jgi:serine/threonine protein kinase
MNEVEILQKIDHPNVVKMKQMYEDKGHYYIAMELMEGGQVSLKNTLIGELF